MTRRGLIPAVAAIAALLLVALAGMAQRGFRSSAEADFTPEFEKNTEFHFVRLEYTDLPEYSRGGFRNVSRSGRASGWWAQDWPDADNHFTVGIGRLTRINIGDPRHLALTDDQLFEYPWIYMTQAAYCDLSDAEVSRLREYLMRGGFLMTDDFWDTYEWEVFRETMQRVLPNQDIPDIQESDSVMHVLYDIREKDRTYIPGTRHLARGQPPGTKPAWRGMYDDKNRMVVAVNFNTDIGDAWEYADAPYYPAEMTILAYRYGINYIIYSLTH
jgi:hypothetical protein